MKKEFTFKKSDVIDQAYLEQDIEETFQRLLKNKNNTDRRSPQEIRENTAMSLVLEHYMMQENPVFKKANKVILEDIYHDLINTESNELHECKVTRSHKGWDADWIKKCIREIETRRWNHSKYIHLAIYNPRTGVYTYKGVKPLK